MNIFARVALCAMAFNVALSSYSDAQEPMGTPSIEEAREALENLPGSKDAVKGPVNKEVNVEAYDIYGRQLSYREGAKEYRKSIDKRRKNFARPREELIENYQKTRDMIYAAETVEYQESFNKQREDKVREGRARELPVDADVGEIDLQEEEAVELKEQKIPGSSKMQAARRTVVTTKDAPDFDPARLNVGEEHSSSASVFVEGGGFPPVPLNEESAQQGVEKGSYVTKTADTVSDVVENSTEDAEKSDESMVEQEFVQESAIEEKVGEEDETSYDTPELLESLDELHGDENLFENPFGEEPDLANPLDRMRYND